MTRNALFLFIIYIVYLLFSCHNHIFTHTITELTIITVAWTIFLFVWNSRLFLEDHFIFFLGISSLFTGSMHLFHILNTDTNMILPEKTCQFRSHVLALALFVESGSLATAFLFQKRKLPLKTVLVSYSVLYIFLLNIITKDYFDIYFFYLNFLTPMLLFTVIFFLYHFHLSPNKKLVQFLTISVVFNLLCSLLINVNGTIPLLEFTTVFFHLVSWFFLYKAIITTVFTDPSRMLFGNLKEVKESESEARKKAETRAAELDALRDNSTDMLSEHNCDRLLETILFRAVSLLNASGGELGLYNSENHDLVIAASCHSFTTKGSRLPLGKGLMGTVASGGKPIIVNSQGLGEAYPPLYPHDKWHSLMASPLIAGGNLVGVITIRENNPLKEFTRHELDLFTMFAQQAALAIRNIQLLEDARRKAETDSLTGLFNHRHFFELANQEITRASRYNHPLTAIMFDIDHFKKVNDTWGHTTGDIILVSISKITRQMFRNIDIVARYGGEEFSVLLPETPLDTAHDAAERLRETIASTVIYSQNNSISVTVSLGLAEIDNSQSVKDLIDRADKALYTAKNSGRNKTVVWNPEEFKIKN